MQAKQRRILGMTVAQLIVVGCLGLTTLGLMGFAASTILGGTLLLSAPMVQVNQVNQISSAPQVSLETWTPLPSRTPEPPTPTFTATTYASLIPEGWVQHKYSNLEFWAPAELEKNPSSTDPVNLLSKKVGPTGYPVNLALTKDSTTGDLDSFIKQGLTTFNRDAIYLERKKFEIGSYEAIRLKVEVILGDLPVEEVLYFIKDGETVWILTMGTHINDFHDWLPVFDQIARTFRIGV